MRKSILQTLVEKLETNRSRLVEAIVKDGWPRPMAEEGMLRHLRTWNPETLTKTAELELGQINLSETSQDWTADGQLICQPKSPIAHVWPALPGAGVTPVLFGVLLGVDQIIRPSSRGETFAKNFVEIATTALPGDIDLSLAGDDNPWRAARLTIVSGSDETIRQIRTQIQQDSQSSSDTALIGYGTGVSLGVAIDDETLDLQNLSRRFATDTVLWHQKGCFSLRGVLFIGERSRFERFIQFFGDSIQNEENQLGADEIGTKSQYSRASQKTLRAMRDEPVYGDGLGFAYETVDPLAGEFESLHIVPCRHIDADSLEESLEIQPKHLQAVALTAPSSSRSTWRQRLSRRGTTRICSPGKLQQPSGAWPHDGQLNLRNWFDFTFVETGDGSKRFIARDSIP